ncbi:hypothetical protein JAAARDRAFT_40993 [Jaapia argillacea MUCL 33604]|uniref:Ubiquitin-like domain-containing protein n=1 Tax=Jaapia argillacea MUCL 33604 TaxID=933084 RepID=A0A067P9F5_9AGAM|nr:hypothetical protein JAAARDRAFT_40993 [Jaapia argillacea MUCL 33604]
MTKFEDKIQGYKKALGRGGSGSSWRKIGWGLFKKQEIVELRTKLATHRQNIILLLTLGNMLSDGVVQEFLNEARQNHMSIKVKLNEIYTAVRQPSPAIGYSRHHGVQLEDVLGSTMILPMELCSTWDKFDSVIKAHFRGRAGQQYVEGHAYKISAGGRGSIRPHSWERLVRKGMVLEMSIVLIDLKTQSLPCPRCHAHSCTVEVGDWLECQYCSGRYRVADADTFNAAERFYLGTCQYGWFRELSRSTEKLFRRIDLVLLRKPTGHPKSRIKQCDSVCPMIREEVELSATSWQQ